MERISDILSADQIKAEADSLGFSACGIAQAGPVQTAHAEFFEKWLLRGCHADMAYMERNRDKRENPRLLMEHAESIVSVALNYYPPRQMPSSGLQLSWYAYGRDYHEVMKEKLYQLLDRIQKGSGLSVSGRAFCDTAPVLEKYWACQCGIGWIGKHTQLVIPRAGSTFFLGELLLDLPVDRYDEPLERDCGTCQRCIEACPVGALKKNEGLDARRCLSYLTIENRGEIPREAAQKMYPYFYGCDRCLKACPHLTFSEPCREEAFYPKEEILEMSEDEWIALSVEDYRRLFKGSAVKRAKYEGLKRNIEVMMKNKM